MKTVAAQMKRIMEKRKLVVNSFEEVLAGRNWNHGEVVELVLRRPNGSFLPLWYLLNVMCHEQMNHGPAFQKLNNLIRIDCKEEQKKGYYGDGFYSSGTHLASSIVVEGGVIDAGDVPEYICGGAANRQAPNKKARTGQGARRRKRTLTNDGQASTSSGAQTAKKRKAGTSNTRVFEGREDAVRIDGAPEMTKDELKRVKALVNDRTATYRTSFGLTIKAATEKAMQSLTPSERRMIETSTRGKSARDMRAAHFERLLATKTEENKPEVGEEDTKPASAKDENTTDDTSDASDSAMSVDHGDLDEYAQEFLGEMDEDEKRVAKGDDVHFFENGGDSVQSQTTPATTSIHDPLPTPGISDKSVEPRSSAGRASPLAAKVKTTAPQFGKSMIDDEKRQARADLLGFNAGGRTIAASLLEDKSGSTSRGVDKQDRSQDDGIIVIED
ncbi:hypothetical protein QFC21_006858 [Naganishia friedmannii]|uniref:Uncharacterized protein n=1 Tax=Naganishia friedmannii TaxID=89922 RepID=A0ACC2UZV3_9TREE|nr:hypothetical protein QFC21_006858 [Naganishia friedmannii]